MLHWSKKKKLRKRGRCRYEKISVPLKFPVLIDKDVCLDQNHPMLGSQQISHDLYGSPAGSMFMATTYFTETGDQRITLQNIFIEHVAITYPTCYTRQPTRGIILLRCGWPVNLTHRNGRNSMEPGNHSIWYLTNTICKENGDGRKR